VHGRRPSWLNLKHGISIMNHLVGGGQPVSEAAISSPSVSRLSSKCESLEVSQNSGLHCILEGQLYTLSSYVPRRTEENQESFQSANEVSRFYFKLDLTEFEAGVLSTVLNHSLAPHLLKYMLGMVIASPLQAPYASQMPNFHTVSASVRPEGLHVSPQNTSVLIEEPFRFLPP
jgi:hypothetical protein